MNSIKQIIETYLNEYLLHRDVEKTLALLSDDICWIGCGEGEKAFGAKAVKEMLYREMEVTPAKFAWKISNYHEINMGDESALAVMDLSVEDLTQKHAISAMNINITCSRAGGAVKIRSIHVCVLSGLQDKDEFFPVSHTEKKLQQDLLDSQAEMTLLMDTVQAGIVVLRYDGGALFPIYFNDGVCRLLDTSRDNLLIHYRKDAYAGLHVEDKARVIRAFDDAAYNMTKICETYRLMGPDNEYIWVSIDAVPVRRTDGNVYFYAVYTDITAERRLLLEGRIREETINIAVEQTGVNIWTLDLDKRKISYHHKDKSPSMLCCGEYTCCVPESFISDGRIFEEDIPVVLKMYDDIYNGAAHAECRARWRSPDSGEYRWLKTIYTTACDDAGLPIKAIGSAIDVTEQMRLEQRYKDFEAYQHLLLDNAFGAFRVNITKDTVEEIIRCSTGVKPLEAICDLAEFSAASARNIPDKASRLRHDEIFNRETILRGFSCGKSNLEMTCRYQIDENTIHWTRIIVNLAQNPFSGDIIGFAYAIDIEDEKIMKMVIDHMIGKNFEVVAAVNVANGDARILEYTDSDKRSFGNVLGDFNSVFAQRAKIFAHPNDWENCLETLRLSNILRGLMKNDKFETTVRSVEPTGEASVKKISCSYLDEEKNTILYTRSDITKTIREQNALNEKLKCALKAAEEANAAKSDFLSRMSHDMRTPMNGIIGLTNLAQGAKDLSDETAEYLANIESSSQYLLSLINDVLDMSSIESNKLMLNLQPVYTKEIVDRVVAACTPLASAKDLTFKLTLINTDFDWIKTDKLRLQQIFINILGNSVKFTPPGGKIEWIVECLGYDDDVRHDKLIIRDTGVGMSADFLPKIFEPFDQEDNDFSASCTGTGLGMPIVKNLVEAMGGSIEVKSEKGAGTEVIIVMDFERTTPVPDAPLLDQTAQIDLSGKRILICEDHPINMQIACKLLEKKGASAARARNGKEGVNAFMNAPAGYFSAILMDIRMPVMDGLEAARLIRSQNRPDAKTIPIIAMTANAYDEDRQKTKEAGMNKHLAKPIEPRIFYEALDEFLNKN
ncbi:MAG: ATP-binding protein [Cloacibacillus sp.]